MARLHRVTGPAFGYPSGALGPLALDWRTAFTAMFDAMRGQLPDAVVALVLRRPLLGPDDRRPGGAVLPQGTRRQTFLTSNQWLSGRAEIMAGVGSCP